MKKILGLDLGVGSIGWGLIQVDDDYQPIEILGMGSRVVPLREKEENNFSSGSGETVCSQRTFTRTTRKGFDRYQLRRAQLTEYLASHGMIDPQNRMLTLSPMELWQLRADAASRPLTMTEIGRVLLHLNQKRGYKHAKSDMGGGKETEFVAKVNKLYRTLHEAGLTVGQYFAGELKASEKISESGKKYYTYRIKENVLPRKAYEEEFDRIMEIQGKAYPDKDTVATLKNIIFYQRPLKSCKHLVSFCDFMKLTFRNKDGQEVVNGPKVAPTSSPIAQVTRIYEAINNIRLVNPFNKKKKGKRADVPSLFDGVEPKDYRLMQYEYVFTDEERHRIFDYLNTNEKLTGTQLLKLLGLKTADGFKFDQSLGKGIKGNATYVAIAKALEGMDEEKRKEMMRFDLSIVDYTRKVKNSDGSVSKEPVIDEETGEVMQVVSPDYIRHPLYELWHLLYSVSDREEFEKALEKKFGITDSTIIDKLFALDFVKSGYSNKSAKFMRMLLPHLMKGDGYSEASTKANVNHSSSLTKEENLARGLRPRLDNLKKGELRQPTVEKILNQMINVVNALLEKYGEIDEIRVELARSLKQSKDERAEATSSISKNENNNDKIASKISELGLKTSRRNIQKFKMHEETGGCCIYCGKPVGLLEFLTGNGGEVEHIIPRSRFFDDSLSNKVCAHRKCNDDKGEMTGYDYMITQGEKALDDYVNRTETLYKNKKISKTKRNRLLTAGNEIPSDFLERDLRQSQYISKKAREILMTVCRDVTASSGSVTDFFRHAWGYDKVLHNINIPRFMKADLVEEVSFEHKGQIHKELRIKGWSKRMDHRHHAIDALVVALTRQGYVQRLNNLNTERDQMFREVQAQSKAVQEKFHLLEEWAATRPHFSVAEVEKQADSIAISIKAGKKLTTPGKRVIMRGGKKIVMQSGLAVPRGELHEGTIYGKIKVLDPATPLKFALQNIHLVADADIRTRLEKVLEEAGHDSAKALKALKKNPIMRKGEPLTTVDCFKEEFVARKKILEIKYDKVKDIIDDALRKAVEERYESAEVNKDFIKFQASVTENSIMVGGKTKMPVNNVRCLTGLKPESLVPVRKDGNKEVIGYAKSGNNHHIAFYTDEKGKIVPMVTTFWTAVKRRALGIPAIVTDPKAAWDIIDSLPESEDVAEVALTLPSPGYIFSESLRINEMLILGMSEDEFNDAVSANDLTTLTNHLYRIESLSNGDYVFQRHTQTQSSSSLKKDGYLKAYKDMLMLYRLTSYGAYSALNPKKVRVTCLGEILFD